MKKAKSLDKKLSERRAFRAEGSAEALGLAFAVQKNCQRTCVARAE
jgi:hypothetical protein